MTPRRRLSHRVPRIALACSFVLPLLFSSPALAGPITIGDWLEFGFSDAGTPATGCDPADPAGPFCVPSSGTPSSFLDAPPWTFTAPVDGATLTVTDAFLSGDRFELFDFGVSLGFTSLPAAASTVDCGDDPAACLATAGISSGLFILAAGNHSLTLIPTLSPTEGGTGYLRVDAGAATAVPEPATWLLVTTGLLVSRIRRQRRDL
jgi:hypothetical protein